MEIKISGNPKEIAELALELQARQSVSLTPQSIVKDLADCTVVDFAAAQKITTDAFKKVRDEKFLIDSIKEILLEHEKIFKERLCNLLHEHDFSISENRDFFYKRSVETIINAISKSINREIWKI